MILEQKGQEMKTLMTGYDMRTKITGYVMKSEVTEYDNTDNRI